MSTLPLEAVESAAPDLDGLPFDAEASIGDAEYARIMRRIIGDSGTDTGVCAFNSSI